MKDNYFPAVHASDHFHCPHCNVYEEQKWSNLQMCGDHYTTYSQPGLLNTKSSIYNLPRPTRGAILPEDWTISICERCKGIAFWNTTNMIYPKRIVVKQPNSDLEDDIKKDYFEAANIYNDSPRASAALLRLALQKLCKQLGEKGENINDDIAELVKKGLNPTIQKALDALRITGNNGVHPGEINLEEEPEKVLKLFNILNFIADKMISEPNEVDSFYESLPDDNKQAVIKRDKKDGKNE